MSHKEETLRYLKDLIMTLHVSVKQAVEKDTLVSFSKEYIYPPDRTIPKESFEAVGVKFTFEVYFGPEEGAPWKIS